MSITVTLSNGQVITKYCMRADRNLITTSPGGKYGSPIAPPPPASEGPEMDSYEHWLLGPDNTSLLGLAHGRSLTSLGTEAYSSNSLEISQSVSMDSTLIDPQFVTMVAVIRRYNPSGRVSISGNLYDGFGGGDGGVEINISPGPTFGMSAFNISLQDWSTDPVTIPGANGDWIFVAASTTGWGNFRMRSFVGGSGGYSDLGPTGQNRQPTFSRPIRLGHYWSPTATTDVAEFILYDRALDISEMQAVYNRSKLRLADRGITVF
jgi:hypothetical protein